jgi:hypothetical protein
VCSDGVVIIEDTALTNKNVSMATLT